MHFIFCVEGLGKKARNNVRPGEPEESEQKMALLRCVMLLCALAVVLVRGLIPAGFGRAVLLITRGHRHPRFKETLIRAPLMSAREANSNPYYGGLDAYAILDVPRTASKAEVKVAYKKSVSKHHPDKFPDDEAKKREGNLRMEKINRAYFCLGDDDRRRRYDKFGEAGVGTSAASELQLKERLKDTSPPKEAKAEPAQRREYRTVSNDEDNEHQQLQEEEIPDVDRFTKGERKGTTSSRFRDFVSSSDEVRRVAEKNAASSSRQQQSPPRRSKEEADVDMYAEIAEFLRRNADKQSAGGGRQTSSGYEEAVEEMNRRGQYGDASGADTPAIASLRAQKRQLMAERERQELRLDADRRDWGDVRDEGEIQARLQAIAEVRVLADRIFEIDCEIDQLLYKTQRPGQYDDFYDDFDFSNNGARGGADENLQQELERLWSAERRRGR